MSREPDRSFLGRVIGNWSDRPVYVVGGGPSLAPHLENLRRFIETNTESYVLAVNRATELLGPQNVDATFSLDRIFAEKYHQSLYEWGKLHEVYLAVPATWAAEGRPLIHGATYLERRTMAGLSTDPGAIANGLHSGYGALNLAVLKGARNVVLLGFDLVDRGPEAPLHWHDGYAWQNGRSRIYWRKWAARFALAARDCEALGVRVRNANPDSAVRYFPFTTYEDLGL